VCVGKNDSGLVVEGFRLQTRERRWGVASMEITTYSLSPYIPVVVFKKAPDFLIKSKTFNSMGK
jgi:hypothetical protein